MATKVLLLTTYKLSVECYWLISCPYGHEGNTNTYWLTAEFLLVLTSSVILGYEYHGTQNQTVLFGRSESLLKYSVLFHVSFYVPEYEECTVS
jgi:hypothetical protein